MKIAGLISRFENGEVKSDNKVSSEQRLAYLKHSDRGEESQQECSDRMKGTPIATSPGRLKIRNAMQNLRSPKSSGNGNRTDTGYKAADNNSVNVADLNLSQRTKVPIINDTSSEKFEVVDTTNHERNMREFLITEHSNRTLVVDNKKKKSQSSTLPDTPWSSRNLGGRSNASSGDSATQEGNVEYRRRDSNARNHQHKAEYGTLALKDEDPVAKETNDDEESLPPEVVAMSAASDENKKKTKAKSLPSLLKTYSFSEVGKKKESSRRLRNTSSRQIVTGNGNSDHQPSSRRRLSTGLLKRRESNDKTEPNQSDISVEPREIDGSGTIQRPARSFSAGNLANAMLKAQNLRERTARSQSPGDPKSSDRQVRPGRKKSERNLFGKEKEKDSVATTNRRSNYESNGIPESSGQPRPPRRIRGRSPGNLVEKIDSIGSEGEECLEEDFSKRPTLVRLESRGRSPGTIRRSINMTGEVNRSQSPGNLNRDASNQLIARSPGTLKKVNSGSGGKSPGMLVNMNKLSGHSHGNQSQSSSANMVATDRRNQGSFQKSGHNVKPRSSAALYPNPDRSRSPVSCRDITFAPSPTSERGGDLAVQPVTPYQPKASARFGRSEITVPSVSTYSPVDKTDQNESPKQDNISTKNLSVPRSKSPGALVRRPAKNPRATQTKKAQSLFEKKSSLSIQSSPKRSHSRDDGLV